MVARCDSARCFSWRFPRWRPIFFRWPSGTAAARRARRCSSAMRGRRRRSGARTSGRSRRSASTPSAPGSTGRPESRSRATYHFENLDVILELAEEEGLKVFLQVYMDSAPRWLGVKYPDSLFHLFERRGRDARVLARILHRPSRRPAGRSRVLRRARESRARAVRRLSDGISGASPTSSTGRIPTYIPSPEFCFCKNTVARFRALAAEEVSGSSTRSTPRGTGGMNRGTRSSPAG